MNEQEAQARERDVRRHWFHELPVEEQDRILTGPFIAACPSVADKRRAADAYDAMLDRFGVGLTSDNPPGYAS